MSQKLEPRGVVDPSKKPTWLKEVKLDATRNTIEHLRRQKEAQEFEAAKARGITVEEMIEKGRKDLEMEEPVNTHGETHVTESERQGNSKPTEEGESEEVARLKAENKALKSAKTKLENKLAKTGDSTEPDEEEDDEKEGGKE